MIKDIIFTISNQFYSFTCFLNQLVMRKTIDQIIADGIKIKYSDRDTINLVYTVAQVETFIKRAFKRKAEATAERNGQVFGRSFKQGGKWNWFVDTQSLKEAGF